jgi:hypothetical protein
MLFLLIFVCLFCVPGFFLVRLLGLKGPVLPLSVGLSYVAVVALSSLLRGVGASVEALGVALVVMVGVLGALVASRWWLARTASRARPDTPRGGQTGILDFLLPVAAFAFIGTYLLWAGPYMEIPADAWWHAGRIQEELGALRTGELPGLNFDGITQVVHQQDVWYFLVAYVAHGVGISQIETVRWTAFATSMIFLAAVYGFGLYIFGRQGLPRRQAHAMAAASVGFFLFHFGVSVFSYVRYYALAPSIMNFVLYFAALALVNEFLVAPKSEKRTLVVIVIMLGTMYWVHSQEALLTAVMAALLVLVYAYRNRAALGLAIRQRGFSAQVARIGYGNVPRVAASFFAVAVIGGGLDVAAYLLIQRHDALEHGFLMPLQDIFPFVRHLYVLRPTLQFYQVVTLWGAAVYVLFALRFRAFRDNPYVVAGMLSPLLTVFNPVFTDFFLRYSWPDVLWRLCYVIPLPFVGGYFLVRALCWLKAGPGTRRVAGGVVAALLVGLVWPVHAKYIEAPFSRLYSIVPVSRQHDYRKWSDLYAYLNSLAPTGVVTDPVTGYTVKALTQQDYPGYKWHGTDRIDLGREAYEPADFKRFDGWLLVVNKRNGTPSRTGALSRHWPRDVMMVSKYYSSGFQDFVSRNPEMFAKMWENNGISVYRIRVRGS